MGIGVVWGVVWGWCGGWCESSLLKYEYVIIIRNYFTLKAFNAKKLFNFLEGG